MPRKTSEADQGTRKNILRRRRDADREVIGGKTFTKYLNTLAAIFTMTPGTVSKWLRHPEAPTETEHGWDVEQVRAFILSKSDHAGVHRKLGGTSGSGADDKPRSWKDRRDRAAALRAERELAVLDGVLLHVDVFDRFCATTIPETVSELRRLLESTLPAKLEGQTAGRIRTILREALDKILNKFENEYKSFKDIAKQNVQQSDKSD